MQKEINSSVILGLLTFILTAVSLWELWCMTPISGKYPELELMICATYGAFIVMLMQILLLLRKPKSNNNVIVVAIEGGRLPSINYVPAASVINMCRKMFEMEYKAAYWATYRCCLLVKHQEEYKKLVADGDRLFCKDESSDKKYVAHLKYVEYGGKESHIIQKLSDMPSEIEAAKFLIRITSNDGQIFYSEKELADWYRSLSENEQNKFAKPVHRFLKDGKPHYH